MLRFIKIFALFIILVCITYNIGFSQAKVGSEFFPFLKFINSPTAAAMGNCSINLTEEQSALYNPGAFGLSSLKNNLSFSLPNNSNWMPGSANGTYLKTYSFGVGININQVYPANVSKFNLSFAIAYSKFRLVSENVPVYDFGSPFDTLYTYDFSNNADYYSAAIGIKYYIKIGVGISYKTIKTDYPNNNNQANAIDYGVLIEFPLVDIISNNKTDKKLNSRKIGFEYTPSFAYVKTNIGDDISTQYNVYYPLAKFSRTGIAMRMALNLGNSSLLSVKLVRETEKNLVQKTADYNNYGHEFGFLGAFYYRWGQAEYSDENQHYKTRGFELRLKGIIQWLKIIRVLHSNRFTQNIIDHLQISFSHAKYKDEDYGFRDNIKFNKLNISYSF